MTLLSKIINQPNRIEVDYGLLEAQLNKLPSAKRAAVEPLLSKSRGLLKNTVMVVPANTNVLTLSALPTAPRVDFLLRSKSGNSPAPESKRQALTDILCLFEELPPKAETVTKFETPKTSLSYNHLSESFEQRHVARDTVSAGQKAHSRYARTQTLVSTFLTPICARYLNDEIRELNSADFFKGLRKYFEQTNSERLLTNMLVTDIVIRSKLQVQKWQCTQDNNFVAYPCTDYIYYCTSDYPNSSSPQKVIASHYVRIGEVVIGNNVINGYSSFGLENIEEYVASKEKFREAVTDHDDERLGVRVYIKKGIIR